MKKKRFSLAILPLAFLLIGCNVGNAPAGMSNEEARSALDKLSPEEKIRYYQSSPMPQAEKEKKYAEIEQKYGVKASDVIGNFPKPGL
jgi:hypothetical protein